MKQSIKFFHHEFSHPSLTTSSFNVFKLVLTFAYASDATTPILCQLKGRSGDGVRFREISSEYGGTNLKFGAFPSEDLPRFLVCFEMREKGIPQKSLSQKKMKLFSSVGDHLAPHGLILATHKSDKVTFKLFERGNEKEKVHEEDGQQNTPHMWLSTSLRKSALNSRTES